MKKRYDCVICGNKKELFDYVNVEELLKIKPNLKPFLWWDMKTNTLKKKVKVCKWCFDEFKEELENIGFCLECKKEFSIQTDIQLCQDCMKLFDTDKLWKLHDNNKLDALDFNESKKFREQFRFKN